MKQTWINFISIVVAVVVSLGGTYSMLISSDVSNTEKIRNIEESIKIIPKISTLCEINSQKIKYHEDSMKVEVNALKNSTSQLQKTTNILTVRVAENTDANRKVFNILEKLNDSISGLNSTIARLDERMKHVEESR